MEKGVVVGYKVVWTLVSCCVTKVLTLMIYSSETGLWEIKELHCLRVMIWSRLRESVPLNGILHWLASAGSDQDADYIVTYDFYKGGGDDEGLIIIPFLYCNEDPNASWKLAWQMPKLVYLVGLNCFPVVMHPLYSNIIYLWSRNKNGLVVLNLTTSRYRLYTEESEENNKCIDGCILRLSGCKEYVDSIYLAYSTPPLEEEELQGYNKCTNFTHSLYFSQYVLPSWLNPLPGLSF
ncbi:putative F-box protein At3g23970 [Eutrema salsugineum]|uniref:putative F-box protein At3g23970 n=1 Tax=Eutrema salsugineum TaxID=72664 RepID=UPI000CED7827|nr:putative F-box protein At3g23970 [Eutrema salsugineum]